MLHLQCGYYSNSFQCCSPKKKKLIPITINIDSKNLIHYKKAYLNSDYSTDSGFKIKKKSLVIICEQHTFGLIHTLDLPILIPIVSKKNLNIFDDNNKLNSSLFIGIPKYLLS